jgi:hypothetical protein
MEIKIEQRTNPNGTHIFELFVIGSFDLEAFQKASQDFGLAVQQLKGKPFRTLIDLTQTKIMAAKELEIFMETQNAAIKMGMERDAFVTSDIMIEVQLERVSRKGLREAKLGKVKFFKTLDQARRYIES